MGFVLLIQLGKHKSPPEFFTKKGGQMRNILDTYEVDNIEDLRFVCRRLGALMNNLKRLDADFRLHVSVFVEEVSDDPFEGDTQCIEG